VPVEVFPPVTRSGLNRIACSPTGFTVRVVVTDAAPDVAVRVTAVAVETAVVVTVNRALLCPDATVTDVGTVADGSLLASATTTPPVPAGALSITDPLAVPAPTTLLGSTLIELNPSGFTVSVAVCVTAPAVAVIVATVGEVTEVVVIANIAELRPEETVTVAGTVTVVRLLARVTAKPPCGATPLSETYPQAEAPPPTAVGLTVTEASEEG